jgi:hypothetical protein
MERHKKNKTEFYNTKYGVKLRMLVFFFWFNNGLQRVFTVLGLWSAASNNSYQNRRTKSQLFLTTTNLELKHQL